MRIAFLFALVACGTVSSNTGLLVSDIQVRGTSLFVRSCDIKLDVEHHAGFVLLGGPDKSTKVSTDDCAAHTDAIDHAVEDGAR